MPREKRDILLTHWYQQEPLLTAREAVERYWDMIGKLRYVLKPGPELQYVPLYEEGRQMPIPYRIPDSYGEFHDRFPDLLSGGWPYSERADYKADYASDHRPFMWKIVLLSWDALRSNKGAHCNLWLGGKSVGASLGSSTIAWTSPSESISTLRAIFREIVTRTECVHAVMGPQFLQVYHVPKEEGADIGTGVSWLTYVKMDSRTSTCPEIPGASVQPFADGCIFEAPTEDPLHDPELFDRVKHVRDMIRARGDLIGRRHTIEGGRDPDRLPPPISDPE